MDILTFLVPPRLEQRRSFFVFFSLVSSPVKGYREGMSSNHSFCLVCAVRQPGLIVLERAIRSAKALFFFVLLFSFFRMKGQRRRRKKEKRMAVTKALTACMGRCSSPSICVMQYKKKNKFGEGHLIFFRCSRGKSCAY